MELLMPISSPVLTFLPSAFLGTIISAPGRTLGRVVNIKTF